MGGRIFIYSVKDSMDFIKWIGFIEFCENIIVIKVVLSVLGKVILGCGFEGLDLWDIYIYDFFDDRLIEYKMWLLIWIKWDGVKILEDDVYGCYRRSEVVIRELVDCN